MAHVASDYYSAASGASVFAGRFDAPAAAILSGSASLRDIEASGAMSYIPDAPVEPGIPGSISLTSASTQTAPFSFGAAFKKGDIPSGSGIAVGGAAGQAVVKSTWSDGSVKFALISGSAALTAGTPLAVTLTAGAASSGTALTTSDLATALAAGVTIGAGAFGSAVFGGTEWASPFKTIASGHRMSSWVYRKQVGSDDHLVAWLEVRLFLGGAVEVLPWIENGYTLVEGPGQKSAAYTFTMGGTTRFSATIDLLHHQRTPLVSGTALTHWLGTDPDLTVIHDTDYLQDTGLVPCYLAKTPQTSAVITSMVTSYTPLDRSNFDNGNAMSGGGAANHIGLLPTWEAAYLCGPSAKSHKAVLINGYSMGRYPIHFRDENDSNRWARLSLYPTTQFGRQPEGGYVTTPATSGTNPPPWDFAHSPSVGALAYLLTGSQYFLDEVQACASYNSLGVTAGDRNNASGWFRSHHNGNTRHVAWCLRSLGQAIGLTPDAETTVLAELRTQFANNATYYKTRYVTTGNTANPIRFVEDSDYNSSPDGYHYDAPWQQDYLTASWGYAMDMDMQLGTTGMADLSAFFHWHAPSIVGRLGSAVPNDWLYRAVTAYSIATAPTDTPDYTTGTGPWYASWGAAYDATYQAGGAWGNSYGPYPIFMAKEEGPISGWSISDTAATSCIAAIAYCVKHNATGAMAAYQRLTSQAIWHQMVADMDINPLWGIAWHPTPKWARGQAVMEWRQMGLDSRMNPTAPNVGAPTRITDGSTAVGGGNSFGARLDAYCGVGVDTRYSKLFTLAAGGHGDYYNNEIVAIDLLKDVPAWEVTFNGSSGQVVTSNETRYTDGQPTSAHTYYGTQTIERHNRWVRLGGSLSAGGSGTPITEAWNASTISGVNGWDAVGVYENFVWASSIEIATCKDPTTEKIYSFSGSNLYRNTPTVNGPNGTANSGMVTDRYMQSLDTLLSMNDGREGATAVDFTRNKLFWTHGFAYDTNVAKVFTLHPTTPTGISCAAYTGSAASSFIAEMIGGLGCFYEPRLDKYLLRSRGAGPGIYAVDAASAAAGSPTVALLTTTGGNAIEAQAGSGYNGVFNKFTRVPALRGAAYISGAFNQIWFLRLY